MKKILFMLFAIFVVANNVGASDSELPLFKKGNQLYGTNEAISSSVQKLKEGPDGRCVETIKLAGSCISCAFICLFFGSLIYAAANGQFWEALDAMVNMANPIP